MGRTNHIDENGDDQHWPRELSNVTIENDRIRRVPVLRTTRGEFDWFVEFATQLADVLLRCFFDILRHLRDDRRRVLRSEEDQVDETRRHRRSTRQMLHLQIAPTLPIRKRLNRWKTRCIYNSSQQAQIVYSK